MQEFTPNQSYEKIIEKSCSYCAMKLILSKQFEKIRMYVLWQRHY